MQNAEFYSGKLVAQEIEELHKFFQDWFNGHVEDDISRFSETMADDFRLVPPSGIVIARSQIIDMIVSGYNTQNTREIWVENILTRRVGDLVVATYHELQKLDDKVSKRISTAIFSFDPSLPCGSLWHHVHETWVS